MIEVVLYLLGFAVCCASYVFGRRYQSKGDRIAVDQMAKDLPALLLDYENVRRKAKEYFEKIEETLQERETWRQLYMDQAAGHDNAQALMLQTISSVVQIYERETGKKMRIDPMIDRVREDWKLKHGPDIREGLGIDGRRKISETKTD